MSIELEARRLITRARKINRRATRARTGRLCLPCQLHICRIPPWALRGLAVAGLALDAFILVHI